MRKTFLLLSTLLTLSVFLLANAAAMDMKEHGQSGSEKFGDLIHESNVEGYMLSYYFMDLRQQKSDGHDNASHGSGHGEMEMDKPHHLMLYIMDTDHNIVKKGKVGFLIKDDAGNKQKIMGMFMSDGFGITADMKKKGVYTIVAKAVIGDKKLMDSFEYRIK